MKNRPSTLEQVATLCDSMLLNLDCSDEHSLGKKAAYTTVAKYIREGLSERELGEACMKIQSSNSPPQK